MRYAIEYQISANEYEYSSCDPDTDDACVLFFLTNPELYNRFSFTGLIVAIVVNCYIAICVNFPWFSSPYAVLDYPNMEYRLEGDYY